MLNNSVKIILSQISPIGFLVLPLYGKLLQVSTGDVHSKSISCSRCMAISTRWAAIGIAVVVQS